MSKFKRSFIDILSLIFLIGIPLGIWLDNYRWKLIWTSLFAIFIAVLLVIEDSNKEIKSERSCKNV